MYPAMSVVHALGAKADVLWLGSEDGMEAGLVARAGLPFVGIPAAGLHGVGLAALPRNLFQLGRGVLAARKVLRRYQPDVLFFTGGFVGVPAAIAGRHLPQVLYVPDIEPGLAAIWTSRWASAIAATSEGTRSYYADPAKVVVTGYPTRPELGQLSRHQARADLGLQPEIPTLLVFGGSRGARSINAALWRALPALLDRMQILHITGELDWPRVEPLQRDLAASQAANYHPHPYLHAEMGAALAAADLVVSRAGASCLGEYPLLGLPSILVPYPHAWRYQEVNARHLVSNGAARMLLDEALDEKLVGSVLELMQNRAQLEQMSRAARSLALPQAAQQIAALISDTAAHAAASGEKDGRND